MCLVFLTTEHLTIWRNQNPHNLHNCPMDFYTNCAPFYINHTQVCLSHACVHKTKHLLEDRKADWGSSRRRLTAQNFAECGWERAWEMSTPRLQPQSLLSPCTLSLPHLFLLLLFYCSPWDCTKLSALHRLLCPYPHPLQHICGCPPPHLLQQNTQNLEFHLVQTTSASRDTHNPAFHLVQIPLNSFKTRIAFIALVASICKIETLISNLLVMPLF